VLPVTSASLFVSFRSMIFSMKKCEGEKRDRPSPIASTEIMRLLSKDCQSPIRYRAAS
jgi:hypothetical protein